MPFLGLSEGAPLPSWDGSPELVTLATLELLRLAWHPDRPTAALCACQGDVHVCICACTSDV